MNGWDLFNTPFSTPVKTVLQRQSADRPQQKPAAAQHNASTTQEQKITPLPHQTSIQQKQPTTQKPKPAPLPVTPTPVATEKVASKTEQVQNKTTKPEQAAPTKSPATTDTKPATPQKELVLDMSSNTAPNQDDTAKRKAHEESEAKRKAEWEAKQAAKKKKEEEAIRKLNAMSAADITAAAASRIRTDTERLTRRNMKECISEHIQTLCGSDPTFARKVMHPRKNMINCFKFITRMAKDYVKQELEELDIRPDGNGYGCDVPDGLVYQWAEDYFNDPDASEDQEKEEKFIPKPYTGTPNKPAKAPKKPNKKPEKQQEKQSGGYEQISLEGVIG